MNESYQHPGKWQDIILIPTVTRTSGNHFLMSHVLRGLEHDSVYEAIVQAKNRYGWNEVIANLIKKTLHSIQFDSTVGKKTGGLYKEIKYYVMVRHEREAVNIQ